MRCETKTTKPQTMDASATEPERRDIVHPCGTTRVKKRHETNSCRGKANFPRNHCWTTLFRDDEAVKNLWGHSKTPFHIVRCLFLGRNRMVCTTWAKGVVMPRVSPRIGRGARGHHLLLRRLPGVCWSVRLFHSRHGYRKLRSFVWCA